MFTENLYDADFYFQDCVKYEKGMTTIDVLDETITITRETTYEELHKIGLKMRRDAEENGDTLEGVADFIEQCQKETWKVGTLTNGRAVYTLPEGGYKDALGNKLAMMDDEE